MLARLLAAGAAILFLAACTDSPRERAAKITAQEAKDLRIAASQLYKELRAKRAPEYLPLKPARWPKQFKQLKPLRVGLYPDGAVLAMQGDAASEQGIHVLPIAMDLAPTRGRVKYDKIQEGIYWYRLGK